MGGKDVSLSSGCRCRDRSNTRHQPGIKPIRPPAAQRGGQWLPEGAAEQAEQCDGWPQPHFLHQVRAASPQLPHVLTRCSRPLQSLTLLSDYPVSSPRSQTTSDRWEISWPRSKVRRYQPMAVWSRRLTMFYSPSWTSWTASKKQRHQQNMCLLLKYFNKCMTKVYLTTFNARKKTHQMWHKNYCSLQTVPLSVFYPKILTEVVSDDGNKPNVIISVYVFIVYLMWNNSHCHKYLVCVLGNLFSLLPCVVVFFYVSNVQMFGGTGVHMMSFCFLQSVAVC